MTDLVGMVEEDIGKVGLFTKGLIKGIPHGLYTPLFFNSGGRRFKKYIKSSPNTENAGMVFGYSCGLAVGFMCGIRLSGDKIGIGNTLLIMAGTNLVDYLFNAYQRSRRKPTS